MFEQSIDLMLVEVAQLNGLLAETHGVTAVTEDLVHPGL